MTTMHHFNGYLNVVFCGDAVSSLTNWVTPNLRNTRLYSYELGRFCLALSFIAWNRLRGGNVEVLY